MAIKDWIRRHPQLTAWAVLAVGMVIILIWAAKDVGFLPRQWAALIVVTILLAGLCVWIIGLGEQEQEAESGAEQEAAQEEKAKPGAEPERDNSEPPAQAESLSGDPPDPIAGRDDR